MIWNAAQLVERVFPELHEAAEAGELTQMLRLEVLGVMHRTVAGDTQPVHGHKRQELLAALLEA